MNRSWMMALSLAVLAGELTSAAAAAKPSELPAGWLTDYAAAKEAARKAGKPILVHFK